MIIPRIALWKMVQAKAATYGMDPFLLLSQVYHESSGDPEASRYEPHYKWTWPPPANKLMPRIIRPIFPCSKETEGVMQRVSWGLMQIMGAVARELQFKEPFLTGLSASTDQAFDLGCQWMRKKLDRYATVEESLSAYNAGSPTKNNYTNYTRPIIERAEVYRKEIPRTA